MGYRRSYYRRGHYRHTSNGVTWVRGHNVHGHSVYNNPRRMSKTELQIIFIAVLMICALLFLLLSWVRFFLEEAGETVIYGAILIFAFVFIIVIGKSKSSFFKRKSKYTDMEYIPKLKPEHVLTSDEVELSMLSDGRYSIKKFIGVNVNILRIPTNIEGKVITQIGRGAFEKCINIEKILIEDGIYSIQSFAFYGCSALETVFIPKTVREIGDYAFAYCKSLTQVRLPDTIQKISKGLFSNCEKLKLIKIPSSVVKICDDAFYETISLNNDIYIPNGVKEIGALSFSVSVRSYPGEEFNVFIPDSVDTISPCAFKYGGRSCAIFRCSSKSYAAKFAYENKIKCYEIGAIK